MFASGLGQFHVGRGGGFCGTVWNGGIAARMCGGVPRAACSCGEVQRGASACVRGWGARVFVSGGGGLIQPSGRTPPPKRAQLTGPPKSYRD